MTTIARMTRLMFPLMSPEGDGGAGGGAGEQKPTGNGDATNNVGDKNSPGDQNAGDKGGDKGNGTPQPDRKHDGILRDLQKERTTRQSHETTITTLQTQLEQATKRIQALAGVNPPSQQEADEQAIKDALTKRFPALAKLDEKTLDRLLNIADKADTIEESNLRQWTNHGRMMLDGVVDGVAKELGGELTDRQRAALQRAYYQRAELDPDFLERHERGDKSLIADFVKEYVEDWVAPARRGFQATQQNHRRSVPNSKDRSTTSGGGKKIDYTNPKAVEDAMVASFKEHGGTFGD